MTPTPESIEEAKKILIENCVALDRYPDIWHSIAEALDRYRAEIEDLEENFKLEAESRAKYVVELNKADEEIEALKSDERRANSGWGKVIELGKEIESLKSRLAKAREALSYIRKNPFWDQCQALAEKALREIGEGEK